MSFRCNRHGLDFNSKEELQDHEVKTHPLPKNPTDENIKNILKRQTKSKQNTIRGVNKTPKNHHHLKP
jgi:hypothetical protein